MGARRPICARRLAWAETPDDTGHPVGLRLPRTLTLELAPELWSTQRGDRRVSALLTDAVGLATDGEMVLYGPKPGVTGQAQLWIHDLSGVETALVDPENAGALAVLAFERSRPRVRCWYLVCSTIDEESSIEQHLGPVEPDLAVVWGAHEMLAPAVLPLPAEIPQMVLKSEW